VRARRGALEAGDAYIFEVIRLLGVEVGWGRGRHGWFALKWFSRGVGILYWS